MRKLSIILTVMASDISISFNKESLLRWTLLALVFVPLVVTKSTLYPYVFGKTVFIRLVLTVFWMLLAGFLLFDKQGGFSRKLNYGFLKNPIFTALIIFMLLGLVSLVVAPDISKAFFGDIERGEGYINIIFMGAFFVASSLVFRKRDWLSFFKLSLLVGTIVAGDAVISFLKHGGRPNGSFTNNPTFVAAYLLFVLFAAFSVLGGTKEKLWRWGAYTAIVLSGLGIAVTNTRGVIVGVLAGIIAVAVYGVLIGNCAKVALFRWRVGARKIGAFVLSLLVLFSAAFVLTIHAPIWQGIPGLNRLSEISLHDNTTESRLIALGVSLHSVNPADAGISRLLFGYGPDNFNIAFNRYYNPEIQRYDHLWFDRAHNKLMDVLVMHGLFGLIAYLAIWYFVFRFVFREMFKKSRGEEGGFMFDGTKAAALFFGTAYFVQNLFVFDQVTTYIPLYAFLAFIVFVSGKTSSDEEVGALVKRGLKYVSATVAGAFAAVLVFYSFVPFYQMSIFIKSLKNNDLEGLYNNLDSVMEPYNYAQPEIRFRVLTAASALVGVKGVEPFVDKALEFEKEVINREPLEPRYLQIEGFTYDLIARTDNKPELYPVAEDFLKRAEALIPGRQEINFLLAQNVLSQGRPDEAQRLTEQSLAFAPDSPTGQFYYTIIMAPVDWGGGYGTLDMMHSIYIDQMSVPLDIKAFTFIHNAYNSYLKYFYEQKDSESFLNTLEQSLKIERLLAKAQQAQLVSGIISEAQPSRVKELEQGITIFERGGWDAIRLQ